MPTHDLMTYCTMSVAESGEEVIFENSALFQHLQDVGFSKDDIHAEKIHAETSADQFVQEVTKPKAEWFSTLKNGTISRILGCYQRAVHEQDAHYKTIVSQTVARSKALVEDDAAFLENFVALPKEQEKPKEKNPHELTLSKVLRAWSHWAIVLAYLVHRLTSSQQPDWYVFTDICAALVMAFYLIPTTVLYLFLWRHNAAWMEMMQQLQMYLKLAAALSQFMKKSVRFIQEMELINRGFTMTSALSPVSRLEQTSRKGSLRQCPQLRQILFHVSRDIMLIHKRATCILLDVCPLLPEVDNSSNYIANISLDEYGPCLSIILNSKEAEAKLMEATDDYALAALKAMCQLCELQFSEFTRRFALSHVTDLERPTLGKNKKNKKLVYVCMLRELIGKLQDGVGTLQRMYEFHKCSVLERRRSSAGVLPMAKTPQENVHVAVHSLELHLLSLLKRVRDVQDTVQAMEPSEKSNLEVSILSEYQIMKMDLDACRGCWEEGLARLEKLFDVNQEHKTVSNVGTPTPPTSAADIKPIPLISVDSPLIQDEVFEAYTDDVDEIQRDLSWDEFLTPEEKAKKKREKEEAKRLLNELRSVITVKAAERERREQVAMERMKGQQEVVKGQEGKVIKGEDETEGEESSVHGDVDGDLDTSVETLKASVDTLDECCEEESNEDDMAHGDGLKQGQKDAGELRKSDFVKSKPDLSFPDVLVPGPSKNDTPSSASGSCSWQVLDDTTPSSSASWQVIDEQQSKEGSMVLSDGSNYSLGDVTQGSRRQSSGRISQSISSDSPSFELIPKSMMAESESSGSFDILPDSPEEEDSSLKAPNPQPVLDPDLDRERIEDKLERVCGANLAFTSNVAAMAVARSQNLGLQQDTFGDDSDDDDDDDENGVTILES